MKHTHSFSLEITFIIHAYFFVKPLMRKQTHKEIKLEQKETNFAQPTSSQELR